MNKKNKISISSQALKEVEKRRRQKKKTKEQAKEIGGRKGPEPTRYNDWEKDGIISDF
ncbi:MAG: DUF1674 domain-containing protein [Rhodobiaceae bacterium]|jgi:hypothetical protein|nr:DUF1674 domain-containing protein [Rhodobiaceae bacterium]|tara:strand:+ start:5974 stop:6147 length:174 start_codon:yes stop_codon:yes gene_type:complete